MFREMFVTNVNHGQAFYFQAGNGLPCYLLSLTSPYLERFRREGYEGRVYYVFVATGDISWTTEDKVVFVDG